MSETENTVNAQTTETLNHASVVNSGHSPSPAIEMTTPSATFESLAADLENLSLNTIESSTIPTTTENTSNLVTTEINVPVTTENIPKTSETSAQAALSTSSTKSSNETEKVYMKMRTPFNK
jgi:hypothetical protein